MLSNEMSQGAAADLRVARFTVDQVRAMVKAGILREGEPMELVDGLLVHKDRSAPGEDPMTVSEKHNLVVKLLGRLDSELARRGCHMQTQGPVSIPPRDEPEPDGAVVRGEPRDYADRVPTAADVEAVIEVAESSLENDRTRKLALYARAGIRQYLIINLRDGLIEVYEEPLPDESRFARTAVLRPGDLVRLRLGEKSALEIDAASILP